MSSLHRRNTPPRARRQLTKEWKSAGQLVNGKPKGTSSLSPKVSRTSTSFPMRQQPVSSGVLSPYQNKPFASLDDSPTVSAALESSGRSLPHNGPVNVAFEPSDEALEIVALKGGSPSGAEASRFRSKSDRYQRTTGGSPSSFESVAFRSESERQLRTSQSNDSEHPSRRSHSTESRPERAQRSNSSEWRSVASGNDTSPDTSPVDHTCKSKSFEQISFSRSKSYREHHSTSGNLTLSTKGNSLEHTVPQFSRSKSLEHPVTIGNRSSAIVSAGSGLSEITPGTVKAANLRIEPRPTRFGHFTALENSGKATAPCLKPSPTSKSALSPTPIYGPFTTVWHVAIENRMWTQLEELLLNYDSAKYRNVKGKPGDKSKAKKPQRKLKIFKFLQRSVPTEIQTRDYKKEHGEVSPLLKVDAQGRTPLHLACKESTIPSKLFQRLLFVERKAASIADQEGRFPLHVAILYYKPEAILDKLIRAYPNGLTSLDNHNGTPLAYAVQQAISQRDTSLFVTWRIPTSKRQLDWQTEQVKLWSKVKFLLDTLALRRRSLHSPTERLLLVESLESLASPPVINLLLAASVPFLKKDLEMTRTILEKLIRSQYPIQLIQRLLAISSPLIVTNSLIPTLRQGTFQHFREGCIPVFRDDGRVGTTFQMELLQPVTQKGIDASHAAQEWWKKLRLYIAYSSLNYLDCLEEKFEDIYVLHMALSIPDCPTSLIEFLVRLLPYARYEVDPLTGALPIHLACRALIQSKGEGPSVEQIFNLLLAGDFTLVWKRFKNRIPIHHAIESGKPWSVLQILLSLDPKTARVRDPKTKLFPFQLAACQPRTIHSNMQDSIQVGAIFELLRSHPYAASPQISMSFGCPAGTVGPITEHYLKLCYRFDGKGWVLNQEKAKVLRDAVANGKIPESLDLWWSNLKVLIWYGKVGSSIPPSDDFLLHAALCNDGDMPPLIVELILELFPAAARTPVPSAQHRYPLHLAAAATKYVPMPFEQILGMENVLEMIFYVYPEAFKMETAGARTVLHTAIVHRKSWHDVGPLVVHFPDMLAVPDPSTELFPFQLAAVLHERTDLRTRRRIVAQTARSKDWSMASSMKQKANALTRIRRQQERDVLSTVYELLRRKPEALAACFFRVNLETSFRTLEESFSDLMFDCCGPGTREVAISP